MSRQARLLSAPLAVAVLALALLSGCASVPIEQQAFALARAGEVATQSLRCRGEPAPARVAPGDETLPEVVRIVSWNLHKNEDPGWDRDLARFAAQSDLVLLQEAALTDTLHRILADAGYDALLGSAFRFRERETGVLNAARVQALSGCTQRSFEPLLRLPKATVITRYAMQGVDGSLAVANVHAINFSLALGEYREQMNAIAAELTGHRGPVIVAGDFNTWSAARLTLVREVMESMGLSPIQPLNDVRSRFFGREVDYVFVRGLEVVRVDVTAVESSDHNPVMATLRAVSAARRAQ